MRAIFEAVERIFVRAGKRLHDVDFIGDEVAKRAIQIGVFSAPVFVIGHAIGGDGHRHPVIRDPSSGRHFLIDKDGNPHALD
jgi:hypothetical protein